MNKQTPKAAAANGEMPPHSQLIQLVGSCFVSQAVYVAAKIGIADLLAESPKSSSILARETQTHERSLFRLLRTLTSFGVFSEIERKVFANSPISEKLRTDAPGSLRDMTIWMGEEAHWRVYGNMLYSVRTGKAAWSAVHGEDVFPYLFQTNRELGDIFNRAMASLSSQTIPAILAAYDFSDVKVLADIAGGCGHLLAGVLRNYPEMRGVLFDLMPVCQRATEFLEKSGVGKRAEKVCGSFFENVPVKADVYMLKHIIHDWNDDECLTILKNIRANMPENGRILILETVIPEESEPHFGKIIDLEMLVSPGGIERTEREFEQLLADSNLELNRIIPTQSMISIIEATVI